MWRVLYYLIRFYQRLISPLMPSSCRFHPSCSAYAAGALRSFGLVRGTWLAVRRLVRCHPWHPGGYDPVPLDPPWRRGGGPRGAPSQEPPLLGDLADG